MNTLNRSTQGARARALIATARTALALLTACFAWSYALNAIAAPRDKDLSFGGNNTGVVLLQNAPNTLEGAYAIAQQADGKLLLAGFCVDNVQGNAQFCVRRLQTNGLSDPSFGGAGTGRAALTLFPLHPGEIAAVIEVQPDGKILVGGTCNTAPPMVQQIDRFCVARLLPNGALDSAGFGNAGFWSARVMPGSAASSESVSALLLQADGKIIVVGNCYTGGTPYGCHIRLSSNGQPDPTYSGAAINSLDPSADVRNAALQPDGKWLLAGTCPSPQRADLSFDKNVCVVRINANGAWDGTFAGGAGMVRVDEAIGQNAETRALSLDGNGDLIVGAACWPNAGSLANRWFCLRKVSKDGVVDTRFPAAGVTLSGITELTAVAVQGDGKLLATGTCDSGSRADFCVSRFHADGAIDNGFSATAPLTIPIGSTTTVNVARAALIQRDGKIVIAGHCDDVFAGNNTQLCATRMNGGPLDYAQCSADSDGDGAVSATDSALLARAALGFRDAALTQGLTFAAHAVRATSVAVRDYLVNQCGMHY